MKIQVKVFADYSSTGLWVNGANDCPENLGVSSGLQLALKYWHEMWEFYIADDDSDTKNKASSGYVWRWMEDGRKLAELMSAENDKYDFVYKP